MCKTLIAAAGAAAISLSLSAATLYVDKTGAGGAYTTIQAAVDAATASDTVFVKNGVYDSGTTKDAFSTAMDNRVYITKSITIVGESRAGTIVKGAHATAPSDVIGNGADAVRCFAINADNVVISNLTITGGATHSTASGSDQPENNGGAIYTVNGKSGIVVVDCIISNNVAYRAGAVRYGNDAVSQHAKMMFVRCWFDGNGAVNRCPIGRGCLFAHCLFTRHFSSAALFYSATLVNCTVADGNCRNAGDSANAVFYNTMFADVWYKGDYPCVLSNCNICMVSDAYGIAGTTATNCDVNTGHDLFIAPPLRDYRLHNDAAYGIGKGTQTLLETIPEAYRYTDFYGHAFTSVDGKVNIGCAQEVVTPAGGMITFAGQTGMSVAQSVQYYGYTVDGGVYYFGDDKVSIVQSKVLGYMRAATYPAFLSVTVDVSVATSSSRKLGIHSFTASGSDAMLRYPLMDGTWQFMVPPAGKTLTLVPNSAASVKYVDINSGSATEDGTAQNPYKKIQSAINSISNATFGIVYVKEGVYDNDIGMSSGNLTNRVYSNGRFVRLVSKDGIGKAVIVGAPDSTVALDAWPFGCGYGSKRCAWLGANCAIQGFALTGGYSNTNADTLGRRGAALWLDGAAQALDCVITNNVGWQGVAINGSEVSIAPSAYAHRCYIADNYPISLTAKVNGGGGIIRSTLIGSSIIYDNHGNNFGSYERQYTFHCTIVGGNDNANILNGSSNVNCIAYAPNGTMNLPTLFGGVYTFNAGGINGSSVSCKNAAPFLASPENGDFRVASLSPAREYGVITHDEFTDASKAQYYMYGATDFLGKRFRHVNGKPVCGAVDKFAPTVVANGGGTSPAGTNVYSSAVSTVTFTAAKAGTRPFLGFLVNGATQEVAGATFDYAIPVQEDYQEAFTVSAIYDTNWYVEPSGSDSAYGTAAYPKKTLKGGLEYAIAGDKVHVAAGTYNTEVMTQTSRLGTVVGSFGHAARALVHEGVELIGAGAATTFIVGASDPTPLVGTDNGCGPNAVRCVAMEKNAKMSGFTLTGGRTDADGNADDFHGGGVLAYFGGGGTSSIPVVTDCVISNCFGRRGGGVFFGVYNRCSFFDNGIIRDGNGPAGRGDGVGNFFLNNCILDRNDGYATAYFPTCVNCTFGANNTINGIKDGATIIVDAGTVRNSLFLGSKVMFGQTNAAGKVTATLLYNCAMNADTAAQLARVDRKVYVDASCIVSGTLSVSAGDYAPVIGVNPAVDAADKTAYNEQALGAFDVNGNLRFVNGLKLDIGAVEADWKDVYAKKLGSRVAVTAVDPEVELTADGVSIPSGSTLALTVGAGVESSHNYVVKAAVAPGGTCDVTKDAVAWKTFAAGANEEPFTASGDHAELLFAANGSGDTVLGAIRNMKYFLLTIH